MSHDDAEKFCKSLDDRSHLIEIYDLEIQKIVESIDVPSYHRFWIGATDQKEVNHISLHFFQSHLDFKRS